MGSFLVSITATWAVVPPGADFGMGRWLGTAAMLLLAVQFGRKIRDWQQNRARRKRLEQAQQRKADAKPGSR